MMMETPQKPRGKGWEKAAPLFGCDGRSLMGRRIAELERIYADALGGVLSPVQGEQCRQAAQLVALAELERARLAEGNGSINDVVRAQNLADRAVRRLGIKLAEAAKPSRLAQILRGEDA
jgi:hypothetical protein